MDVGVLAFIAAESRELSGLLARAATVRKLDLAVGYVRSLELRGMPAVAAANGPGPELAGKALDLIRGRYELEAVISIGYCGALDPALRPNDIVVGAAVNGTYACLPVTSRAHASGAVFSSDRVVVSAEQKQRLQATGAIAVEMEAAALAARAQEWGVPFYCVRVVTDTAAESLPLDFNACRASDGRFSRSRIILAALRRPGVLFPELMKLDRRCRTASEALGDFVADCRF
jgi:adenosylhomocysteine nucleosidase